MRQVVNRADAERQASAERSGSPQTPHPRLVLSQILSRVEGSPAEGAPDARTRGIKFPVSHLRKGITMKNCGRNVCVLMLAVVVCAFALGGCATFDEITPTKAINPPVDKDGRPLIRKLGTIDTATYAENSLVMFKGKLYSLRWLGNEKDFYFQFEEYESGKKMPPFARGYAFGRSFVEGDTVYVSSTSGIRREEMTKVYLHASKDMVNWQTREVLDQPGWFIFTSPMCKADNRYVMMHDVYGAPPEGRRGGPFCRFSTSGDMKHWKMTPPKCWYNGGGFAAGHFLAYLDGRFYNFYMGQDRTNRGWEMRVARSSDLIDWEDSPLNPVLRASEEDRRLAHPNLTDEKKKRIATMTNINNGDMCLIEYKGKVIIHYFWGDQATAPCGMAEAIYDGTEAQFLRGWFPGPAKQK